MWLTKFSLDTFADAELITSPGTFVSSTDSLKKEGAIMCRGLCSEIYTCYFIYPSLLHLEVECTAVVITSSKSYCSFFISKVK